MYLGFSNLKCFVFAAEWCVFYLHKPKGPRGQRAAEGAEEGPRTQGERPSGGVGRRGGSDLAGFLASREFSYM